MEHELLIPVEGGTEKRKPYLSLHVFYVKGRGIFLSVGPVTMEQTDEPGIAFRSFKLFSGVQQLIEPVKRLNRKQVNLLFEEAVADFQAKQGPAWLMIREVIEKNGLKLLEELPCT